MTGTLVALVLLAGGGAPQAPVDCLGGGRLWVPQGALLQSANGIPWGITTDGHYAVFCVASRAAGPGAPCESGRFSATNLVTRREEPLADDAAWQEFSRKHPWGPLDSSVVSPTTGVQARLVSPDWSSGAWNAGASGCIGALSAKAPRMELVRGTQYPETNQRRRFAFRDVVNGERSSEWLVTIRMTSDRQWVAVDAFARDGASWAWVDGGFGAANPRIELLDSGGVDLRAIAKSIEAQGYSVERTGPAKAKRQASELFYLPGFEQDAKVLASDLHVGNIKPFKWRDPGVPAPASIVVAAAVQLLARRDLGGGCTLAARTAPGSYVLSIAIACPGRPEQRVTVEGAAVDDEKGLSQVSLGAGLAWVINAYDTGSTYGAQTTVVAWNSGGEWRIVKAPFQRAHLLPNGHFLDTFPTEKTWRFEDGTFVEEP